MIALFVGFCAWFISDLTQQYLAAKPITTTRKGEFKILDDRSQDHRRPRALICYSFGHRLVKWMDPRRRNQIDPLRSDLWNTRTFPAGSKSQDLPTEKEVATALSKIPDKDSFLVGKCDTAALSQSTLK